jgi:hypothetical protein
MANNIDRTRTFVIREGLSFTFLYLLAFTILMGYPMVHYYVHPGKLGYFGSEFIWITLVLLIPLQNLGMMLSHHEFIRTLAKKFRIALFFYVAGMSVVGIMYVTLIKICGA